MQKPIPQTLFLDRDGVVNLRLPNTYISAWSDFQFLPGSLEALALLNPLFPRILIVTNQQGIGKGLMTETQLQTLHHHMLEAIHQAGGRIDRIYHAPYLAQDQSPYRKPNPGMALQAQADFPEINFSSAIIVGDSVSDMQFGQRLGMQTAWVMTKTEEKHWQDQLQVDYRLSSLWEFALLMDSLK
ncbi:MAG: HAD family hydrolase [Bacteroidota bacterium]